MARSIKERVIDALKSSGLVEAEKIDDLIRQSEKKKEGFSIKTIAGTGLVTEDALLRVLSMELGIPPIDLSRVILDGKLLRSIPEKLIRGHQVVPLSRIGDDLTLVVSDPTDILAIDDIKTVTGCNVELLLSTRKGIGSAIRSFFDADEEQISDIIGRGEENGDIEILSRSEGPDVSEMERESGTAPIVKMVSLIIDEAVGKRASDIHVEPQEKSLRIRYRIDGELHDVYDLPKKNQNALLARLKIMSNLDITENRVPQDGRFRVTTGGKEIDFRVSVLPLIYGNKIVLRALDKSNLSVGLDTLGFLPGPLADFKTALARPFGIILVTGPTGSGKSTTLYSVLNEMNVPEKSIITVEDPVEYQVEGITQIAARPEIGLDFANGLRAILRQSPDVIMVGEIRDFETADIAVKASLTGQMVLSTLHTNDSVGAITRLVNMGIEPFLIASSLVMACAQRLLKRICPDCREKADIPPELLEKIRKDYPESREAADFYRGRGCASCGNTGYRGRLGTLETLLIDEEIKDMIYNRRPENDIRDHLREKGVRTLRDNAMIKFIKGWTTLEEVYRVT